jgi:hypothetical protein
MAIYINNEDRKLMFELVDERGDLEQAARIVAEVCPEAMKSRGLAELVVHELLAYQGEKKRVFTDAKPYPKHPSPAGRRGAWRKSGRCKAPCFA